MRYPQTYVVYDLETTGLDTAKAEAIEIGAVRVVKGEITEKKTWLLKPSEPIEEKVTEITGITNALLDAEGRPPGECWMEFLDFIKGSVVVGHNISRYDNLIVANQLVKHLTEEQILAIRFYLPIPKDWIDTAALYKAKQMGSEGDQLWRENHQEFADRILNTPVRISYRLTEAYAALGGTDNLVAHRALGDCLMTQAIYAKMTV